MIVERKSLSGRQLAIAVALDFLFRRMLRHDSTSFGLPLFGRSLLSYSIRCKLNADLTIRAFVIFPFISQNLWFAAEVSLARTCAG
jgi:hypothetical protein